MNKYKHLKQYYMDYLEHKGKAEHDGCFPNLIIWIREVMGDDQYKITEYLNMTEDAEEEFYSWGHNSRWSHVVEPMIYNMLIDDADPETKLWLRDTLVDIADAYGDVDVEARYFNNKDEQ